MPAAVSSSTSRVARHRARTADKGAVRIDVTLSDPELVKQWIHALYTAGSNKAALTLIFNQAQGQQGLTDDMIVAAVAGLAKRAQATSEPRPTSTQKSQKKAGKSTLSD